MNSTLKIKNRINPINLIGSLKPFNIYCVTIIYIHSYTNHDWSLGVIYIIIIIIIIIVVVV